MTSNTLTICMVGGVTLTANCPAVCNDTTTVLTDFLVHLQNSATQHFAHISQIILVVYLATISSSTSSVISVHLARAMMHLKCINDLCSSLGYISWYSHARWCFPHVLHWFLDFLWNSNLFGTFNSRWQKHLLSLFWTFQELRDPKKGEVREHGTWILRRIRRSKAGHQ
jgi:hypothetical protein